MVRGADHIFYHSVRHAQWREQAAVNRLAQDDVLTGVLGRRPYASTAERFSSIRQLLHVHEIALQLWRPGRQLFDSAEDHAYVRWQLIGFRDVQTMLMV